MQGLAALHHLSNWTLKNLPLIKKGKEAEKSQSSLAAEVERLKSELQQSEGKVKGLEKNISQLAKDHSKALKAKDDVLQQKVDSAVKAALEDASGQAVADYKASDEFMGFGFEYLGRGIKATAKWAEVREKEVGTLKASDFDGLGFADPVFAKVLLQVEDEAIAPARTATMAETEVGGTERPDDTAEVTNEGQPDQTAAADEDVELGSEAALT